MIRGDPSGRQHNLLHAEQVYGRDFMKKYRKGDSTIDGESCGAGRPARRVKATG